MVDVARRAGVSHVTVSRVVNGHPSVRPETRARVEAAIAELGYRMNMSARNLRQGRTGMVGLAIPELSLAYWGEFADMVIAEAAKHGLRVLIEPTGAEREGALAVSIWPRPLPRPSFWLAVHIGESAEWKSASPKWHALGIRRVL